jgi:hypothetical protein
MSDIVERLRQQATIEAKKFGDAADIQLEWKAAAEIIRLRAENIHLRRAGMDRPSAELHEAALAELRAEITRLRADRRERIATACLAGLIACPRIEGNSPELVEAAISFADALIARLDKEAKP